MAAGPRLRNERAVAGLAQDLGDLLVGELCLLAILDLNAVGVAWTEERRLPPRVNVEDRKEAEFTDEEIAEVLRQAGYRSLVSQPGARGHAVD